MSIFLASFVSEGDESQWLLKELSLQDRFDLTCGQRVDGEREIEIERVEDGTPNDFGFTVFGIPIVSESVGRAIRELVGDDVQLVKTNVREGGVRYYALNVLRVIDCIDRAASVAAKTNPNWIIIPALNRQRIGNAKLFRVVPTDECQVFVDEAVKAAVESASKNLWMRWEPIALV